MNIGDVDYTAAEVAMVETEKGVQSEMEMIRSLLNMCPAYVTESEDSCVAQVQGSGM